MASGCSPSDSSRYGSVPTLRIRNLNLKPQPTSLSLTLICGMECLIAGWTINLQETAEEIGDTALYLYISGTAIPPLLSLTLDIILSSVSSSATRSGTALSWIVISFILVIVPKWWDAEAL